MVTKTTTYDGDYTVETFTGQGNTTWVVPIGVSEVEILVVAGGGGGGYGDLWEMGGGGGGGSGSGVNDTIAVTPGDSLYIAVGAGGLGGNVDHPKGYKGKNSVLGSLTVIGGGYGGSGHYVGYDGGPGGSGGGAGGIVGAVGGSREWYGFDGASCVGSAQPLGGSGGGGVNTEGNSNDNGSGGTGGDGQTYTITGVSIICSAGGNGGDVV